MNTKITFKRRSDGDYIQYTDGKYETFSCRGGVLAALRVLGSEADPQDITINICPTIEPKARFHLRDSQDDPDYVDVVLCEGGKVFNYRWSRFGDLPKGYYYAEVRYD